ncbi:uncharacterized protein LOC124336509 [Daphnia pulicaria]|uniref:uncharacterized protein LOC124336509 n=1 Tax=Daphnia pulicaria TaxID=35523 RepID=UPI001EEADF58|nr:uncharacterized protein LOC124336509 [Daphnia pulicaria]
MYFPTTATTPTTVALLNHHSYDKASGNLPHLRSNAVCCCNSIIISFCHEHFSVLLRKEHARSPRTSLSQCWILSMTEEGLPPTFCSILIFKTYAHPASLLQRFLCCYTTFLASLASWITSVAVTHLQSLTKGLWPGIAEETLRRSTPNTSPVCQKCQLRNILCCW